MISVPEELLEQVERGNVLLFVGERIARDRQGGVLLDGLTSRLVARCAAPTDEDLTFPEAAQLYEEEKGRQALVQFVGDELEALGDEPQRVHHLIAGLSTCRVVATTCFDRRLERAYEEADRRLSVVVGNLDVALVDERKTQLYKLRGSWERPESLVLTEGDTEAFFEDQASISLVLQGYLARWTILFVGYELADPYFRQLYRKVVAPLDKYARRAYAFGETPAPKVSRWCQRHGIDVVQADATTFLEALTQQLAARAQPLPAVPRKPADEAPEPLPERPYKLLDYYEARDAAIFFGREREVQTLGSLIHGHRLVLLHGASGVGKTSLLLAGVLPRLERADPPYVTVYGRALEYPTAVIRREVRQRLPEENLPQQGSLVELVGTAIRALDRPLVIVLDQFEEFFIRLSPQFREAFIAELGDLYDAHNLPVKIVLSLREDWLAAVSEIEERIPEVFRTRRRLLPLTRDQASEAIIRPVARLGIDYEAALVEELLDDLMGSETAAIMPPQLQLVCSTLYDGLESGERQIKLAAYECLGRAKGVLGRYLDDELARLPGDEQTLARAALTELVTSRDTKDALSGADLLRELEANPKDLERVLMKLVGARLLRVLDRPDSGPAYELAHECLIDYLDLEAEGRKRKRAKELLRQEVENWQRFGTLPSADKLAVVSEVREALKPDAVTQEMLLRSALRAGTGADYWLGRLQDPERRAVVLTEAIDSDLAVERREAARLLGPAEDPELLDTLPRLAIYDPDLSVRAVAREHLAELGDPGAVERVRAELVGADLKRRYAVLETLAVLPPRGLPLGLRLQIRATHAITWIIDHWPSLPWFLGWVLATAAIRAVSSFLLEQVLYLGLDNQAVRIAINALLAGGLLGTAQAVVLRLKIHLLRWWILATIGGYVLANAILWLLPGGLPLFLSASLSWALMATAQWLVLRKWVHRAQYWIAWNVVAGLAALLIAPLASATTGRLVFGIVTGIALLWLLDRPKDS